MEPEPSRVGDELTEQSLLWAGIYVFLALLASRSETHADPRSLSSMHRDSELAGVSYYRLGSMLQYDPGSGSP